MRRRMLVLVSVVLASLLVTTSVAAAPATSSPAPATWSAPRYHTVRPGETLFSIGRLYGVNPYAIASANHLYNANRIYIGQCLYIPASSWYYSGCKWGYYGGYNRYGCYWRR
jgi:LysM repeat protein